jgi:4-hydroxybenzoate polyprenyltransferase
MAWLQLIRWKNLVIIFFTQLMAWLCVILPASPQTLSFPNFCLLSISTMLIAAAGYIINDYFDIRIDLVNRPDKVVLGKAIARKTAILPHAALNIIALGMAGYVAAQAHHYEWVALQAGCILLLWFYSTHFKRQLITGNMVVAMLAALTILVMIIYEPALRDVRVNALLRDKSTASSFPFYTLMGYAYFAFMLTWMREIVKDMEDLKGDALDGCTTMPVKFGLRHSSWFVKALAFLVIAPLSVACLFLYQSNNMLLAGYITIVVIAPLVVWILFLNKRADPEHYHNASRWLKIIMLPGIFALFIYHLQLLINRA